MKITRRKIKSTVIKYRGLIVWSAFVLFNILESIYFGQGTTLGFNKEPMSIAELVCDDLSTVGMLLSCLVSIYDLIQYNATLMYCAYKQKKEI